MAKCKSFLDYYLHQSDNIATFLRECIAEPRHELVHRLRLSIKKLKAFNLLADELCLAETEEHIKMTRHAQKLYKLAGKIRDLQVQQLWLAQQQEKDKAEYPEFAKWMLKCETKEIAKLQQMQPYIIRYTVAPHVQELIREKISASTDKEMRAIAEKLLRQLSDKARALSVSPPDAVNLHSLRIITKRLRYLGSIVENCYPETITLGLAPHKLRKLEDITGQWHDREVTSTLLKKFRKKKKTAGDKLRHTYAALQHTIDEELSRSFKLAYSIARELWTES